MPLFSFFSPFRPCGLDRVVCGLDRVVLSETFEPRDQDETETFERRDRWTRPRPIKSGLETNHRYMVSSVTSEKVDEGSGLFTPISTTYM